MNVYSLLPIAVPVVFWAAYHYHKDRHLPEPAGHLVVAFCLGIVAAGLSRAMYVGLGVVGLRYDAGLLADTNTPALLAYAMLGIGPIEEFSKLLPFLLVLRFREFDEIIDGIIYASFVALGYAAVENWLYLEYLTPLESLARGFAAPIVHIVFASVWGYAIARAYLAGGSIPLAAATGFAIASALHGIYDFMVLRNSALELPLAALLIAAIWTWRLLLIRRLQRAAGARGR